MATIVIAKTGRKIQVETRGRPRKGETATQAKNRRIRAVTHPKKGKK